MPNAPALTRQRNQSMECFKMVASLFVVFLHVPFPGKLGQSVSLLAGDFAVPVFFAISGYFNYGADAQTLSRRLKHLLKLYALVIVVTFFYGILSTELLGGSSVVFFKQFLPDLQEIGVWLFFQKDPRNAQLWYLTVLCLFYLVLQIYTRFFGSNPVDYRPLYLTAAAFCVASLLLICIPHITGEELPYILVNNAYTALPMFTLGLFLHQYQDAIRENFSPTAKKLVGLLILGQLLVRLTHHAGLGNLPFGNQLKTVALMLLMIYYPTLTTRQGHLARWIGKFGAWSTYIYILHILVLRGYQSFLQPVLLPVLAGAEPFLAPLFVAGISFVLAVVFELAERGLKSRKAK